MELSVKFTVTELELLEALLKTKYRQLKDSQEQEDDLIDLYKQLYSDALTRIRSALYVLHDEPVGISTKKHPVAPREGSNYQMLQ